ncbi:hypothetical protein KSS87_014321 [Heliosperma pusillum]|nr:hypothetical protein KSS87_014321 [Heliosperma pusillum]
MTNQDVSKRAFLMPLGLFALRDVKGGEEKDGEGYEIWCLFSKVDWRDLKGEGSGGPFFSPKSGAVRVMAKDLIRTRHQVDKFYKLKSQLQGVSLRIQTLKSTQAMGEAMKGVTKAMGQMNKQMNLPNLQKIMQEFERQNERMELTGEVMGDAIDDALEGDEEETETDELVNQVLDEIGIDINQELVNAPSSAVAAPAAKNKVAQAEATASDDTGIDDDLQARLDNLRRM